MGKRADARIRNLLATQGRADAVLIGWDTGTVLQSGKPALLIATEDELLILDRKTGEGGAISWDETAVARMVRHGRDEDLHIALKSGVVFTVRIRASFQVVQTIVERVTAANVDRGDVAG